jgi:hypothetical protein
MKLKNRNWTDAERRLGAADSQILQEDRTVRAGMLALTVFGVAVLAGMAIYLICLSPPPQDSDPGMRAMRTFVK